MATATALGDFDHDLRRFRCVMARQCNNAGTEHDNPNQVTLDPEKSGEIVRQSTKGGNYDFACSQPKMSILKLNKKYPYPIDAVHINHLPVSFIAIARH